MSRYCGREFTTEDMDRIREIIANTADYPHREAIARAVCDALHWFRPDGGLKTMSCKVALLRMHRQGEITLPPPTRKQPRPRSHHTAAAEPQIPVVGSRGMLRDLQLVQPSGLPQSRLWNELMQRYHYLGYQPLPGAQLRYFIYGDGLLLGALGFGAAAWKVAPRDHFIGWSTAQREQRLHLIVNNARFLVLPWVSVRYLASSILALAAKQLPDDWQARYAYRPLLLETFVECPRFSGTCYRAANWTLVGQTQGRGKLDRLHLHDQPVKDIYLYPLHRHFRQALCADLTDQPNSLG